MTHTVSLDQVPSLLRTECRNADGDVALLAGHFAIFSAGGSAEDFLGAPHTAPAGASEMLAFTQLTWQLGCDAVRELRTPTLVVLVDDMQFVRPALADRAKEEQLAAALAAAYLRDTSTLPSFHLDGLVRSDVEADAVYRHRPDRWMLSERELRHAAVRHLREQFTEGRGANCGLAASDDGNVLTVSLPEQREFCVVHSGHTGCAGGYAELLSTLHGRGIRKLVAMVPARCLTQVSVGTELARQLFGLAGMAVTSIAFADPALAIGATVTRHPA